MADDHIPCIFTLGAQTKVTDPQLIIAYTLRHFIYAPKSASDTYQGMMISLNDCMARAGRDRNAVRGPIITQLEDCFRRIFGESAGVSVQVDTPSATDDLGVVVSDIYYTIVINVRITYGAFVYSADPSIYVENDKLILKNDILIGETNLQEGSL